MDIKIRHEIATDYPAVTALLCLAFGGTGEEDVVNLLHTNGQVNTSLVATVGEQLVGQILFSEMSIVPPQPVFHALGLAPLAVLLDYQSLGIGSRLVEREGWFVVKI